MAPHPVTTAGSLTCSHGGAPTLTSSAKLTVGTKPVILYADVTTFTPYTGCQFKDQSGNVQQCTTTSVVKGGEAAKLTSGGNAVLLDDLTATGGTPAPPTSITVKAGQAKLTAASKETP